MRSNAVFDKVSFNQFSEDWLKTFPEDDIEFAGKIHEEIKLPKRATKNSAGYDFYLPCNITLYAGDSLLIPTGIRCTDMEPNQVLAIFPRSGLGTKYRFIPANLVAIIDSDYSESDNEGHIFMKMVNDGDKTVELNKGDAFCQGILLRYDTTDDDEVTNIRNGGMGSTDKK